MKGLFKNPIFSVEEWGFFILIMSLEGVGKEREGAKEVILCQSI